MSATLFVVYIPLEDEDNSTDSSDNEADDEKVQKSSEAQVPQSDSVELEEQQTTEEDPLLTNDSPKESAIPVPNKTTDEKLPENSTSVSPDSGIAESNSASKSSVTKVPDKEVKNEDRSNGEDDKEELDHDAEIFTIAQVALYYFCPQKIIDWS